MLELKLLRKLRQEPIGEYQAIADFSSHDIEVMYSIYEKYYENTQFKIFSSDFAKKSGAFLIRHPKTNEIVGFSTVMDCEISVNGKIHHAFFSGDTVIEKEFWGNRALQRAMYRYLIQKKLKHPTEAVYWMLISKGFKTYLLLANNYFSYFPHYNNKNQHLAPIVDAYCRQYFDKYYDADKGILNFGNDYQPLKGDVAPITQDMLNRNAKIRFFEQCNPDWAYGTELPCIGEITWRDIGRYVQRFLSKTTSTGKFDAVLAAKKQA